MRPPPGCAAQAGHQPLGGLDFQRRDRVVGRERRGREELARRAAARRRPRYSEHALPPARRIVAQVGHQHAGGEIGQLAPLGRPVITAVAAGQHGQAGRVGAQALRLDRRRAATQFVRRALRRDVRSVRRSSASGGRFHRDRICCRGCVACRLRPSAVARRFALISTLPSYSTSASRHARRAAAPARRAGRSTFDHAIGRAGGVPGQNGFHRLHGGHGLPVGRQIVVGQRASRCQPLLRARRPGRRIRPRPLRARTARAPRCRSRAATARPTVRGTCRCSGC